MSIDYTKWDVGAIRAELVKLTGANIQDVEAIKGKANLVERLIEARQSLGLDDAGLSVNFGEVEMETKPLIRTYGDESEEEEVPAPTMGSPEWEEFVLAHLSDKEVTVKDGKRFPKAHGLRRVAEILCGPIVGSGPIREYISNGYATIVYEVKIQWTKGLNLPDRMSEHELMNLNIPIRTFTEVADCTISNTPSPYNLHAPATASSKAQGRVFKSILQLSCHTAEEMGLALETEEKTVEMSISNMENDGLSKVQRIMIDKLSDRLDIDVSKALEFHSLNPDINKLTRVEASSFIVILNKYQTDVTDASMQIPDIIKVV